jgi:putative heme-binding domain-containing protein
VATDAPQSDPPTTDPILRLARQPQLSAAWSRKLLTDAKHQMGDQFSAGLVSLARDPLADVVDRIQAIELLKVYGTPLRSDVLAELSQDSSGEVRGRAIYLLGVYGTDATFGRLVAALDDKDPAVRRRACEAIVRSGKPGPVNKLLELLREQDRVVVWAARRALERLPRADWESAVLSADNVSIFIQGATGLMVLDPDRETVRRVIDRVTMLVASKQLDDDQTLALLRIAELALYRSRLESDDVPRLRETISRLYPSADWRANRELVRVLVYLQDPTLAARLVSQLQADVPLPEKIHAAMYARFLRAGWTPELSSQLINFYEFARKQEGGNSFKGYLTNAARDFLKSGSAQEQLQQIAAGAKTPGVTLALVQALAKNPNADELAALQKLDREIAADKSEQGRELAKAVLVALARGDAQSRSYLHQVFETTPDRRGDVAQALSSQVQSDALAEADWQLLCKSLSIVDGQVARGVLQALLKSPRKSSDAGQLRQVILLGLKLQDRGGQEAAALLEYWTGEKQQGSAVETTLALWQDWYRHTFPDAPEPALPVDTASNKYTFAALTEFLASDRAEAGDAERGAAVFEKALCIKCHRYGTRGEGIGPDLTNVSSRFQRKEILESVLFPSQVISDQFAAKTVLTTDGTTYSGLVGPAGDGIVVLQPSAEKVTIANGDIEMIVASKKSAMPEGLFSPLTLDEIADLFAYLGKPPATN